MISGRVTPPVTALHRYDTKISESPVKTGMVAGYPVRAIGCFADLPVCGLVRTWGLEWELGSRYSVPLRP